METATFQYYVCLNQHCPHHRGIFLDGNSEHAGCAREQLRLGDERSEGARRAALLRYGLAAVVIAAAAGAFAYARRSR